MSCVKSSFPPGSSASMRFATSLSCASSYFSFFIDQKRSCPLVDYFSRRGEPKLDAHVMPSTSSSDGVVDLRRNVTTANTTSSPIIGT